MPSSSNWNLLSHPHRRRQLFNFEEESKSSLIESRNRPGWQKIFFIIENQTLKKKIKNTTLKKLEYRTYFLRLTYQLLTICKMTVLEKWLLEKRLFE
jgi:hypothetical protein